MVLIMKKQLQKKKIELEEEQEELYPMVKPKPKRTLSHTCMHASAYVQNTHVYSDALTTGSHDWLTRTHI